MLTTAKSAAGFSQVVQKFYLPHPQTLHTDLAQKIPFINSKKNFSPCPQCAHKYWGLVGFSMVRVSVRVRDRVSIRVSLV